LSTAEKRQFVAGMAAKYSDRLRRFLKFRLPHPSDVPDLAQEVFMRLLRAPIHEDIRSPEAYLFTVASHVIQQHQQRQVPVSAPIEWIEALADTTFGSSDEGRVASTLGPFWYLHRSRQPFGEFAASGPQ
jgi:DNA-directed RNA polymerase specialized sigma24 family protein